MNETNARPVIVGRSSSHFTRITRIVAAELRVDYDFRVVPDLLSTNTGDYAGNPALRLPILHSSSGTRFGALNICRELAHIAASDHVIAWPEDLAEALPANAQELVLQAMATEVTLVMGRLAGVDDASPYQAKQKRSLENIMAWLNDNADELLASLPAERELSYLEVALFCLVAHLAFREVIPLDDYPRLRTFREGFAERESAQATEFRFD